jgi:putative cardiolipin synthase
VLFDDDKAFIGSSNLDPRSLRINTEMGLLIESLDLNQKLRQALEPDFSPRNAWLVKAGENGDLVWVSDDTVLKRQPAHHFMRNIEDWFLTLLPIENEM